jgi:energy-coupling factor transporter ATP-binding protein EcfA2
VTTQEARGRPRRRYSLRRVRLVNFHNFVDETIEVPDSGHLFLLGDNGSGKTTVLDAIHYVLSGGQELDWNAAARLGGRKEGGRSVQGIVLRYDAERGVLHEAGAIAYAVLELEDSAAGEHLCLGIGTEATTMEARVTRWGIVRRGGLDEVPVLVDGADGGRPRPTAREELRERLGRTDFFAQLTDYRKTVAERLFGSVDLYEEVCRFWGMAKAYREIVAGARDFGTLFGRLLPVPDAAVLGEILRSLHEIDDLEVTLRELEAQASYVEGLVGLTVTVARHREAISRYRWLRCFRDLEEEQGRELDLARQIATSAAGTVALESEGRASAGRLEAADEALRAALATDPEGLLGRIRTAEASLAERRGEAEAARSEADLLLGRSTEAAGHASDARSAFSAGLEQAARAVQAALAASDSEREEGSAASRAAASALEGAALLSSGAPLPPASPSCPPEALEGATTAEADARELASAASRDAGDRRQTFAEARAVLTLLEAGAEEPPAIEGFGEILAALGAERLVVRPLYELLEPSATAGASELAALEALAGEEVLACLVASKPDVARVRAIVARHAPGLHPSELRSPGAPGLHPSELRSPGAPGLRVLVRTAEDALLPAWARSLFAPPQGELEADALAGLSAALAQPGDLGEVPPPGVDQALELRGLAYRGAVAEPRLLGREARRRQRRLRVAAQKDLCARLDREVTRAEHAEREARQKVLRGAELLRALGALGSAEVTTRWAQALESAQAARHAIQGAEGAERRAADAARRAGECASLVETLRARLVGADLDALEQRLVELRRAIELAREAHRQAVGKLAVAEQELASLRAQASASREQRARLASALAAAAAELRAHQASPTDDAALERYVRVQQRGDQFKSLEAIRERIVEEERGRSSAEEELARDGSRGVKNLQYASRFGFSYDPASNRLEDRRQEPAAGVLARLQGDLGEQREVVGERTRSLMDTLVMGALARHLQEQVERLTRMVKDINRLLESLRFGSTQYQFVVKPKPDRQELVELVRRLSLLDEDSRRRFRSWIDERLAELKTTGAGETPELLDYRRWYDYSLRMKSATESGIELRRELRVLGSGGEQGVPNYLLVLALAKLMFDSAEARLRPLLFDEAFYGIDQGRRDQLLRFATELGLQLFVASPDQDGANSAAHHATTLFIVKDDQADVHLAPYHYWNRTAQQQTDLFETQTAPDPDDAECKITPS